MSVLVIFLQQKYTKDAFSLFASLFECIFPVLKRKQLFSCSFPETLFGEMLPLQHASLLQYEVGSLVRTHAALHTFTMRNAYGWKSGRSALGPESLLEETDGPCC
jgi:hypothetical protein